MAKQLTLSAHQPSYLPWMGYFDKIARADVFVYLDTVQYEKNSFINRNRIKTPQGPLWLTIPVKTRGHMSATLLDTEIDDSQPWRTKHLKSIAMNYRKAPQFEECFPKLESLLLMQESNLAEYCWRQLDFWLNEFGIATRVVRSSEFAATSHKSNLVLDLCRHFNADQYLSGALGRDYINEHDFNAAGILVDYQDYSHPVYPQLGDDFLPCMSVIDFWINGGGKSIFSEA